MQRTSPAVFDPCVTADNIACFQVELTDLGWRHINVILTRQVIVGTDKSESILHNLKNSIHSDSAVKILDRIILACFLTLSLF